MHTRREKDLNQAAQVFQSSLRIVRAISGLHGRRSGVTEGLGKEVQNGMSALGRFSDPAIGEKIGAYLK